jgi:hypothetical protein
MIALRGEGEVLLLLVVEVLEPWNCLEQDPV